MPSWPIEMPSDTEIVPNSSGYPPAACTPSLTALASRSSGRLQGVISFQLLATPICGLAKSSSPIPTARSIPRAAARSRPSVTSRLRGLMSGLVMSRSLGLDPGAAGGAVRLLVAPTAALTADAVHDPGQQGAQVGVRLLPQPVHHRVLDGGGAALGEVQQRVAGRRQPDVAEPAVGRV